MRIKNLSRKIGCWALLDNSLEAEIWRREFVLSSGESFTPSISFMRRNLQIPSYHNDPYQRLIHLTTKPNTSRPYSLSLASLEGKGFWSLTGQCLATFRYLKGSIHSWSYSQPDKNMWITIALQLHNMNLINLFHRWNGHIILKNNVAFGPSEYVQ